MNRTRCPWCGKIIDKYKDKAEWKDRIDNPSVSRRFVLARCSHCRHKYGQVFFSPYVLTLYALGIVALFFGLVLKFVPLLFVPVVCLFLSHLAPYSKLNEDCTATEEREELIYDIAIIESYGKIKPYEIYFLEDNFDSFEPFIPASPVQINRVSNKKGKACGSFLYMNENNCIFTERDECNLYDTDMVLAAKIKFLPRSEE